MAIELKKPKRRLWFGLATLTLWGPGLVVMLADTDAGSIITASQSGAQWGYRIILPQMILIPILYVVQEMTVRLGIITGKGHGMLIREHFGHGWALLSASTLVLSSVGALITEFAGIAGVGELFGISRNVTIPTTTVFLLSLALTGSYSRIERVGLAIGSAELAFIPAMFLSHPKLHEIAHGISSIPLGNNSYLYLLAANVGAVIMPWMIFYQQGAVIDKKLSAATIRQTRADTAVGAILTQVIMIAVVVCLAATVGRRDGHAALNTVGEIAHALTPFLGATGGKILFSLGILGASIVAAIVATLAGAWGVAEIFNWKHSLNEAPNKTNSKFYLTYAFALTFAAILVLDRSTNLVALSVDVEVMNALLLPIVLGFLLLLESRALPVEWRMRGWYKYVTWIFCFLVIAFGLFMIPSVLSF